MGSLHLCYHSHFILVLTVLALGWLMTETGWYQLAESFWWLFSVFSLVDVLWWVLTCDTKIFTLHPYSSTYIHMFLPQTSLFLVFQYFHSRKKDGHCFLWFRSLTSGQLFFHTKWTARCTTWSSAHWEDFPSLLSFKTTPQCGCNAATVCFQLAPTYWSIWISQPPFWKAGVWNYSPTKTTHNRRKIIPQGKSGACCEG